MGSSPLLLYSVSQQRRDRPAHHSKSTHAPHDQRGRQVARQLQRVGFPTDSHGHHLPLVSGILAAHPESPGPTPSRGRHPVCRRRGLEGPPNPPCVGPVAPSASISGLPGIPSHPARKQGLYGRPADATSARSAPESTFPGLRGRLPPEPGTAAFPPPGPGFSLSCDARHRPRRTAFTPALLLARPRHYRPTVAPPERATDRCGMNCGESPRQLESPDLGIAK